MEEKLTSILGKKSLLKNIGESWEISGIKEAISIVLNKELKGTALNELIIKYKNDLLGDKVYRQFGNDFPLLIKFIDAKEALSIQVHPNDDLAKKARHQSFGKNEMWYVLQAEKNANLIIGHKKNSSVQEFNTHIEKQYAFKHFKYRID